MILSLLYKATPIDVRFIMIDTNMLELSVYEKLPHSLTRVINNTEEAVHALHWFLNEMKRRCKLISALGVHSLIEYNQRVQQAIDLGHPIPNPFWIPSDGLLLQITFSFLSLYVSNSIKRRIGLPCHVYISYFFRHVLAICRWNRHTEIISRKIKKTSTCHQQTSTS
ncbi:FtsK/SpoIIIE domain-containing protein [Photorhabdus sp. CRCIA-P01]|uniref:FtsK/SpoIIIE domain-containing protein n=1 Tax=Photorhabdus sp. CRCIA-P01 TaxID=2019570 RepID=UPI0030DDD9BE